MFLKTPCIVMSSFAFDTQLFLIFFEFLKEPIFKIGRISAYEASTEVYMDYWIGFRLIPVIVEVEALKEVFSCKEGPF